MGLRFTRLASRALTLGVVLASGCGDVRLYPLKADPPIPTECPTEMVGFATMGGGTTGGGRATPIRIAASSPSAAEAFAQAAALPEPAVIEVDGLITLPEQTDVASDKTILGIRNGSGFTGSGLDLKGSENVIIRNVIISKALDMDAILLQESRRIWIDHCELSSDRQHDVDYYDGLVDVTHASDFVTISWTRFHDHFKTTLVGHSADNAAEDTGHLTVTYHHNAFIDLQTGVRARFGNVHAFNNYFRNVVEFGLVSQMGASLVAEKNYFERVGSMAPPVPTITTVYLDPMEGMAIDILNELDQSGPIITSMTPGWLPTYPYSADSAIGARALVQHCAGVDKIEIP